MNEHLTNYYIESPEFNDFLELFEEEEFREEHCAMCDKSILVRSSIEADGYICLNCTEKAVLEYIEQNKK